MLFGQGLGIGETGVAARKKGTDLFFVGWAPLNKSVPFFSGAAQQKFGKDFENSVRDSITESLMAKGKDFKTASAEAAVRAKEIRSDLAALHDPDMVAGGWLSPEPVKMGDPLVNSSIGGSWPRRLMALDEQVSVAIANGSGQAQMNVRLELLRGSAK